MGCFKCHITFDIWRLSKIRKKASLIQSMWRESFGDDPDCISAPEPFPLKGKTNSYFMVLYHFHQHWKQPCSHFLLLDHFLQDSLNWYSLSLTFFLDNFPLKHWRMVFMLSYFFANYPLKKNSKKWFFTLSTFLADSIGLLHFSHIEYWSKWLPNKSNQKYKTNFSSFLRCHLIEGYSPPSLKVHDEFNIHFFSVRQR